MTRALYSIPYGKKLPNDPDTAISVDVISFAANTTQIFYASPTGDDGSAKNYYEWQSIFVDNSLNDFPLTLTFTGTLSRKIVPANSQGFVPVACPKGAFSFMAECANPAAINIPIELWADDVGPSIWGTKTVSSFAPLPAPPVNDSAGVLNVNQVSTVLFANASLRTFRKLRVKNITAGIIWIRPLTTQPVTTTNGYPLSQNESVEFDYPAANSSNSITFRAIADSAGAQLAYFAY